MKATIKPVDQFQKSESFELNLSPCNVKFLGTKGMNVMRFQVLRFPRKALVERLVYKHLLSVELLQGILYVVEKRQGVDVYFKVRYQTVAEVGSNQTLIESFVVNLSVIDCMKTTGLKERKELLNLVSPHLGALKPVIAKGIERWAVPSFAEYADLLSDEQKEKAAAMLYREFIA